MTKILAFVNMFQRRPTSSRPRCPHVLTDFPAVMGHALIYITVVSDVSVVVLLWRMGFM